MEKESVLVIDNNNFDRNDAPLEIEIMEFNDNNNNTNKPVSNFSDFSKYINNDSTSKWSRNDEKIVKKFILKGLAYKTLYNQSFYKYSTDYKLITWPLIILTCISIGLQMIASTFINITVNDKTGGILTIITTVSSITVSILTYLQAINTFKNLSNGCRKAGIAFSEYADQLNTILTLKKSQRANTSEVIQIMQSDYKKLMNMYSDYQIPDNIYKNFIKEHQNDSVIIDFSLNMNENTDIDKNIINKFLDSIIDIKNNITPSSSTNNLYKN